MRNTEKNKKNLINQDSTLNPEFNNNIPKGVYMDDDIQQPEENQDASQNPNADQNGQDASDSTQSNEGTNGRRFQQPSRKDVAIVKNAIDKKSQKFAGIEKAVADINAILDRGYYKVVTMEKKQRIVRCVDLTDSDRQFEEHKLAELKVERKAELDALAELKKQFKALTTRSIDGNKQRLAVMKENTRKKTASNNAVNALKEVVTKETINSYPSLISFAQEQQDNWIQLESFFSVNLASVYNKFRGKPELKERIFSRSTTYIKNLIK